MVGLPDVQSTYLCSSSKIQSLPHRQLREMDVHLSLVDAVSFEIRVHRFVWDSLVVQVRRPVQMKGFCLSGEGLQERRTATS
jgi:hypothetical protein